MNELFLPSCISNETLRMNYNKYESKVQLYSTSFDYASSLSDGVVSMIQANCTQVSHSK